MKKIFLHISAITLMVYILISSMGVLVYEHHCSKAGTFYGVYTEFEHHCEEEKEVSNKCESSEKSCCKKPSSKEKITSSCCSTNLNWVQLDTDLSVNEIDFEFEKELDIAFTSNFKIFQPQPNIKIEECRGPPPKLQKPSQSLLQSYLI
ncbi:MAG: hypothetical protein WED10_10310 [Brumimicrobium sp.]